MFYVLMGILVTSVAVLIYNHEAGELFGYSIEAIGSVALMSTLLLFLLSGRRIKYTGAFKAIKYTFVWVLFGAALVLGYSYKEDVQFLANRIKGELVPGSAIPSEGDAMTFRRSGNGHFVVQAAVDGVTLPMLVDSGASTIVLTYSDALAVGVDVASLSFTTPVSTANGRGFAARIWLDEISVGGIAVQQVPAMIAKDGALRESLLGMSYLDRLGKWSVSGDRLTLVP